MVYSADELIPTRATLLQRLKDWQDRSSWEDFFNTYGKLIYGVALKGGLSRDEAKDVVQETLFSVAKNMPTFKYDPSLGSFKGWLLNLTRWRISDQIRKRDYLSILDEPDLSDLKIDKLAGPQDAELEKVWDVEWENNLFDAALANARRRLEPGQLQLFVFYVRKEWPPEKVAETFSVPIGQVYLAKHRVGEVIRQEVERLRKDMI